MRGLGVYRYAMIEVDGRELHVERRGGGEPLLLLMGMSMHTVHWGESFLDALADDFDVIAFDHRGTGRSAPAEEGFILADLAGDAAGVLEALGVHSAHVLGVSMGGMVAQELALERPEMVRTLILGCTFAGGEEAIMTAPETIEAISEAVLSGDRERAIAHGYEVSLSERHRADPANWEPFRAASRDRPVPVQVTMMQLKAINDFDAAERIRALDVPTLVIHGSEDRLLDVRNGELVAQSIPGARLEILEGVGHMFFWEEPERSAELVREHALGAHAASVADQ